MRIAICYRGIHYSDNDVKTDYRKQYENNMEYLINPLKKNNIIDIFCVSYESEIQNSLINDYKPVMIDLLSQNIRYHGSGWYRQLIFHKKIVELVKNYENKNNINYDIIINLRYDLLFKKDITLWNIDYNKINFTFKHLDNGNSDDNFYIIPRKYLDEFNNSINKVIDANEITHAINRFLDENIVCYCYIVTIEDNKIKWGEYKYYILNRINK